MLTALAIDDEPKALEVVQHFAAKVPFLRLEGSFTDAFEALDFLQKQSVDLLFLDIKMPDISGLEFLRTLPKQPMVVFTTAYSEHAVASYDYDSVDYLLKPFALDRFVKACNKALDIKKLRNAQSNHTQTDGLFIKNGYEQIRVQYDDILYAEASGNYVIFITKTQKVASRLTMNEAEAILPPALFSRIHRSYIVSKQQVSKYDRYEVYIDKTPIPIGANYGFNLG